MFCGLLTRFGKTKTVLAGERRVVEDRKEEWRIAVWISMDRARDGMVVKSPVLDAHRRPLVLAGAVLTNKYIQRLNGLGIAKIEVEPRNAEEKQEEEAAERPVRDEISQSLDRAFSAIGDDPFMTALKKAIFEPLVRHRMRK